MKAKDKHGPVSDVLDMLRINEGLDARWIQQVLGRSHKQVEECLTILAWGGLARQNGTVWYRVKQKNQRIKATQLVFPFMMRVSRSAMVHRARYSFS